jgi:hypothetical protein
MDHRRPIADRADGQDDEHPRLVLVLPALATSARRLHEEPLEESAPSRAAGPSRVGAERGRPSAHDRRAGERKRAARDDLQTRDEKEA